MLQFVDGIEGRLREYAAEVDREMAAVLDEQVDDDWMRGAISYHLGWADTDFRALPEGAARPIGKKLRPGLALLSYQGALAGRIGSDEAGAIAGAVPFAAALEMLHNYSLVHDDVQDADRMRRGRPTLWTLCGEAQAINVGNCMHMLAFGCLDRLRDGRAEAATVAELVASMARTSIRLTVGQKRDLAFEHETDVTPEMYLEMIGGKTAALTRCATFGGALLALGVPGPAGSEATLEAFADYGWQLGLGFQIRDDVLGIWGAESATGKASGGDIRRRKKSLPVLFAFQTASVEDRERLRELYARPDELTSDEEAYVRAVLDACQAEEFAQDRAESHRRQAMAAVTAAAGGEAELASNPFLLGLRDLADFATGRAR
jgi:geranylgeranyl diphosphate synthase type I